VNIVLELLFNPLNAELNPTCHLLALLGAHPILHISRIRVNPKIKKKIKIVLEIQRHFILGYDAVKSGRQVPTFRTRILYSVTVFSSTFLPHFCAGITFLPLKKEAASSSEKVVPLYQKHVIFPKVITMILL